MYEKPEKGNVMSRVTAFDAYLGELAPDDIFCDILLISVISVQ